jgi:hypothetical protein
MSHFCVSLLICTTIVNHHLLRDNHLSSFKTALGQRENISSNNVFSRAGIIIGFTEKWRWNF